MSDTTDTLRERLERAEHDLTVIGRIAEQCQGAAGSALAEIRAIVREHAALAAQPAEQEDGWLVHSGGEPPALHPMRAVEIEDIKGRRTAYPAKDVHWAGCVGCRYRPLTSPDGLLLVMAAGLQPWARYVFTFPNGGVIQSEQRPKYDPDPDQPWWDMIPRWTNAPAIYAAEPWDQSLMAVYRENSYDSCSGEAD